MHNGGVLFCLPFLVRDLGGEFRKENNKETSWEGMVIPTEVNSEESDWLPHRQDSGVIGVFVFFPYLTEATKLLNVHF